MKRPPAHFAPSPGLSPWPDGDVVISGMTGVIVMVVMVAVVVVVKRAREGQ